MVRENRSKNGVGNVMLAMRRMERERGWREDEGVQYHIETIKI